jgi:hypothetical protein
VTLTLQAYGGYEGWETVGTFTAADKPGQRVVIDLKEHAPQMRIINPDGTTIEVAPVVAPAPGASAPTAATVTSPTPGAAVAPVVP